MPASLDQLVAIRSRLSEEISDFCRIAVSKLDDTQFQFVREDRGKALTISGTAIDSRVFTKRVEREESDADSVRDSLLEHDEDEPLTRYERDLAELNERPWCTENIESIRWSRALSRARCDTPLVVRGAPGSGKTTLSRFSVIQALKEVRQSLVDQSKLPEECVPMLWTTCTHLARVKEFSDPIDLVIRASFDAFVIPSNSSFREGRLRDWLRARIRSGCCVVVLDSLDEVISRLELKFKARAPQLIQLGSPIILTCRVLEWEMGRQNWPGWKQMDLVELAPLTRQEQRAYGRRFFQDEIGNPDLYVSFEQQFSRNLSLRKACESPILLFFACLLHAGGEFVGAARRAELYWLMRRRLFRGEWKGLRKPPKWVNDGIRERRVTSWLEQIALALFRRSPEGKTFSLTDWDQAAGEPAVVEAGALVAPPINQSRLLKDLKKCGFLVEAGWWNDEPQYSFLHRSFLASLAGSALAKLGREAWLAELKAHLWFRPAWEDVLLFMAGTLDSSDMDALLEAVGGECEDLFHMRLRWQWLLANEAREFSADHWGSVWAVMIAELLEDDRSCSVLAHRLLFQSLGSLSQFSRRPIETLTKQLDHRDLTDRECRRRVIQILAQIQDASAIPALLERVRPGREPDIGTRARIVEALGRIGDFSALATLRGLCSVRDESNVLIRARAAQSMGLIGDASVVEDLAVMLQVEKEPDRLVRNHAAEALGMISEPGTETYLLHSLDSAIEPDSTVRVEAARSLGKMHEAGSIDIRKSMTALEVLFSRDAGGRRSATEAFGLLGEPSSIPILTQLLDPDAESDSALRGKAAEALGNIGHPDALPMLVAALDHHHEESQDVRSRVAAALGIIRDPEAVKPLMLTLNQDPGDQVRWRAAEALGRIADPSCVSGILDRLQPDGEQASWARAALAESLGNLGDPGSAGRLREMLDPVRERKESVRRGALLALGKLEISLHREEWARLLDAVQEPSRSVRKQAILTLTQSGEPFAAQLLAPLLDPAREPENSVREHALVSLGQVGDVTVLPAVKAIVRNPENPLRLQAADTLFKLYWNLADRDLFLHEP